MMSLNEHEKRNARWAFGRLITFDDDKPALQKKRAALHGQNKKSPDATNHTEGNPHS